MMQKILSLVLLGSLLSATSTLAQDKMVGIYLEPDPDGTVYFQESMSVLDDLEPRPLLDGSGAGQGWMFVRYPGRYVGYVPASEVGPGNQLKNGSKTYLRQDTSSPVLAVILDGSDAEVSRVQDGWATIYFEGEAPAYFRLNDNTSNTLSIVAPAPAVPVAVATPAPTAATQRTPAPQATASSRGNQPPVLQEVVMQESATLTPAPAKLTPPSQSVARYLQGKLERVTVWDRVFGSSYKYRLVDADDSTIAYVILDESMLFGPVENYWGEQVEVQGVFKRITGTVPLEVSAGSIRVLR